MLRKTTNLLLTTLLAIATINSIEIPKTQLTSSNLLNFQSEAQARSSGGRSRGGSFSRSSKSSSKSSSSSSSTSPKKTSRVRVYSDNNPTYYHSRSRTGSGTPMGATGTTIFLGILFFGVSGIIIFLILKSVSNASNNKSTTESSNRELDNDIFTISQLQVALLASAKDVQLELTELSLRANTSTEEGLRELLQESILVLLRHSEYWSHGLGSSEKIKLDQAEAKFESLSLEQRSKLSQETLRNVGGNIQEKTVLAPEDESAMYIVVTLLVGTAHDRPLFKDIQTTEALETALKTLAAMPPDYLLKLELLWSPQAENDSLTYDEFITEYTQMVQLV
ncbi:DUF1517 domain-containing protein [Crocosphaera sp. UHCC 0190]|uniref:DUF1517 domain-containing protein n=1 Tax=Crocosphaera sp. UHCC 0190 TaxID=3110246 RepID=UPI002B218648|nr:DUF1517 domain-containing protein [Crocosphaera sp. UHCC 0190]MEA5510214.1 DUF1517 domain-containing protein [Crocosphaera sp. UHCC 0190]